MKNKAIIEEIRFVLINDWDPLGIGDNHILSDEYDSYIGSIMKILIQKLPDEDVVELLKKNREY